MKLFFGLVLFWISQLTLACPGCAGSMDNPNDMKVVWILCGFILLIYIPFFLIYKTILKHQNLNNESPKE